MAKKIFRPAPARIRSLHDTLAAAYGPQGWWPGDTRLEVMVGAVLTQNAAWTNVEKAIAKLKAARVLELRKLLDLEPDALATLLRPAGYFNVKARRLRSLLETIAAAGGIGALARRDTADLRALLLAVNGIGPETADDILLYAFGRPVFVVDAYTRRLFARLGWTAGDEGYEELRRGVEQASGGEIDLLAELHALIVAHAKRACRLSPRCGGCVLRRRCAAARYAGTRARAAEQ